MRSAPPLLLLIDPRTQELEAHGPFGPTEAADADSPAEFELFGEPGLDEAVMLIDPQRVIGRIVVRP